MQLVYETLREFYGYIYGVEEDKENGVQAVRGAREIMRNRNMFGAGIFMMNILRKTWHISATASASFRVHWRIPLRTQRHLFNEQ